MINRKTNIRRTAITANVLTKEVKDGGRILDIQVLDHIILTPDSYYSYADEGTL